MQLVTTVLGDKEVSGGIDGESLRVSYPGGEASGRRECLVRLARVITPDTAARLELGTRIDARRFRRAILRLAGIGRGGDVDVQGTLAVDCEGMHGMIPTQRQARHDRDCWSARNE